MVKIELIRTAQHKQGTYLYRSMQTAVYKITNKMNEDVEKVDVNIQQPEFTINPVSVIADSFEPEFEISEEV